MPSACRYLLCAGTARASAHRTGELHKSRKRNQNPGVGGFQALRKTHWMSSGGEKKREVGGGEGEPIGDGSG